jgi:hypothetical protein
MSKLIVWRFLTSNLRTNKADIKEINLKLIKVTPSYGNVLISETPCMYLVIRTYTYHFSRYVSRETNTKKMLILKSPIGD